jgi:hypothetical protein
MISCASSMTSTHVLEERTSNEPSGRRNFMRFSDDRLQAESSTCMYSEHGLDALIRPEFGDGVPLVDRRVVLHAGSAQRQAASAISRMSSRACIGSPIGSPVCAAVVRHSRRARRRA